MSPNLWRSWRSSGAKDCLPITCDTVLSANGLADLADLDLFQKVCVCGETLKGMCNHPHPNPPPSRGREKNMEKGAKGVRGCKACQKWVSP